MKYIFTVTAYSLVLCFPVFTFAAGQNLDSTFSYIFNILEKISQMLIPAGFLFFLFRMMRFMKDSHSGSTDLAKSKSMLIWSAIALFFMVGIWSVVAYVQGTVFGGNMQSDITNRPALPTSL